MAKQNDGDVADIDVDREEGLSVQLRRSARLGDLFGDALVEAAPFGGDTEIWKIRLPFAEFWATRRIEDSLPRHHTFRLGAA